MPRMTRKNDLPKYHETFIPILETLSSGEMIHYGELKVKVRDKYYSNLSQELLERKTKSGDQLVLNRIGWGKTYLKQAKFVEQPKRAFVQITEKGLKALAKGTLTLKDVKSDPDYIKHEQVKVQGGNASKFKLAMESASPQDLIDEGFQKIEQQVKQELLERLMSMDPFYFEKVILLLLEKMGYGDFIETKKTGDGGIDGIINQDQLGLEKIYIQAKRYTDNRVREKEIRNFIGAMSGDTNKGVFVTTSTFDEAAKRKAKDAHHTIILINGSRLTDLMYQFKIGLQVVNVYEVRDIDDDFFY